MRNTVPKRLINASLMLLCICAAVAIFATATSAQSVAGIRIAPFAPAASTFYVSSSNCPGPGTGSLADPFCTIQAGVDAASPGDTVSVSPGTYNENVTVSKNGLTLDVTHHSGGG